MAQWLKQSTAVTVKMGPFLDETDGKTAETALTISQADIRLSKNGGAFAQTNNVAGATHDEGGEYGVPLDTTDTNTLGRLKVRIHKTGALPVWQEFMVVPANVWDSMFGADLLQVDTTQWAGAATATDDVALATAPANFAALAITAGGAMTVGTNNDKTGYGLSAAAVQAIWDALTAALTTVGSIGKLLVDRIDAAITSRSSHAAADVWSVATRALTDKAGFSLAADQSAVTVGTVNTVGDKTGYALTAAYDFAKGTVAMTEAYAANGAAPTPVQSLFALHQMMMQFSISGTSYTVRKLDNATTAFTVTLDDATNPSSAVRT